MNLAFIVFFVVLGQFVEAQYLLRFHLSTDANESPFNYPIASNDGEKSRVNFYVKAEFGFPETINTLNDHSSLAPPSFLVPWDWDLLAGKTVGWGVQFTLILINEDMDLFIHLTSEDAIVSEEDKTIGKFAVETNFQRKGTWIAGLAFHYQWGESHLYSEVTTQFEILDGPKNYVELKKRYGFDNDQDLISYDVELVANNSHWLYNWSVPVSHYETLAAQNPTSIANKYHVEFSTKTNTNDKHENYVLQFGCLQGTLNVSRILDNGTIPVDYMTPFLNATGFFFAIKDDDPFMILQRGGIEGSHNKVKPNYCSSRTPPAEPLFGPTVSAYFQFPKYGDWVIFGILIINNNEIIFTKFRVSHVSSFKESEDPDMLVHEVETILIIILSLLALFDVLMMMWMIQSLRETNTEDYLAVIHKLQKKLYKERP